MLGASGSSEGRDSWQRAQAGVSLAPPGCLRGPGAASPVTGPQLQVEQSRGEEKAAWGKAACSLRRRQTGVSARPHAAPRPAMGPLWLQLTVCPKPGLTARSVLRRVRQRLHPVKSFVRITIRSAGPGSHAHPDGQQVPPRQARPAASRVSHWDQKDGAAASGAAQAGGLTPSQPACCGASVSVVLPTEPGTVLPGRAIKTLEKTNVNTKSTCGNTVYSCCSPYLTEAAGPRYEMPTRLKGI